jgi:hypothetical protein
MLSFYRIIRRESHTPTRRTLPWKMPVYVPDGRPRKRDWGTDCRWIMQALADLCQELIRKLVA